MLRESGACASTVLREPIECFLLPDCRGVQLEAVTLLGAQKRLPRSMREAWQERHGFKLEKCTATAEISIHDQEGETVKASVRCF